MKVLVIGSGGREHSLAWALAGSPSVELVFTAPGNPGTARCGENIDISVDDVSSLLKFAKDTGVDLTVVGPELPLTLGIVDVFHGSGLNIFGPTQKAARLEGSKSFTKEILNKAGVSTPKSSLCKCRSELEAVIEKSSLPFVLKADGLAGGKGVFVCQKNEEVKVALKYLFEKGDDKIILFEEYISGPEVSFIAAISGDTIIPFAASHDYKRALDGDMGLNTGGMGAVCPTPRLSPDLNEELVSKIFKPTLMELKKRGINYCGFLYAGLMLQESGEISVLEFNVRFGDPECQAVLSRFEGDLGELLFTLSKGESPSSLPIWKDEVSICLTLAADGYPMSPRVGDPIDGIELAESMSGVKVFHAGTGWDAKGRLITAGGRVLSVVGTGGNLSDARSLAYKAADMIQFPGRQLRRDIGFR